MPYLFNLQSNGKTEFRLFLVCVCVRFGAQYTRIMSTNAYQATFRWLRIENVSWIWQFNGMLIKAEWNRSMCWIALSDILLYLFTFGAILLPPTLSLPPLSPSSSLPFSYPIRFSLTAIQSSIFLPSLTRFASNCLSLFRSTCFHSSFNNSILSSFFSSRHKSSPLNRIKRKHKSVWVCVCVQILSPHTAVTIHCHKHCEHCQR